MFLRGGKVNVVEYWWKIDAKLKLNKQLLSKPEILILCYDNYFVVSVKLNFLLETEIDYIDNEGKVQSLTDTDNEFTEC